MRIIIAKQNINVTFFQCLVIHYPFEQKTVSLRALHYKMQKLGYINSLKMGKIL